MSTMFGKKKGKTKSSIVEVQKKLSDALEDTTVRYGIDVVESVNINGRIEEEKCENINTGIVQMNEESNKISLYKAILKLDSEDECWNFFGELIGLNEYQKLEQRVQIAKLLDCNVSFNELNKKTGVSTETVSFVNQALQQSAEFHNVFVANRGDLDKSPREYFSRLIQNIKTEKECKHFFEGLCNPKERHEMELRFDIAVELYHGKTYAQVSMETGASSAMVGRVKNTLYNKYSLIKNVILRLEKIVETEVEVSDEETYVERKDVTSVELPNKASIKLGSAILYYHRINVNAAGYEDESLGFVLKKGSRVCMKECVTCSSVTRHLRIKYAGVISDAGILQKDIIFKSVNEATNFCAFGTANCSLVWKNQFGKTLRNLRKITQAESTDVVDEEKRKVVRLEEEACKTEKTWQAEEVHFAEKSRKEEDAEKEIQNINESILSLDNISIEVLELSVRTYNCMKRADISSVGQLINLTEDDLQSIRNMGRKGINEILDVQKRIRNGELDLSKYGNSQANKLLPAENRPLLMVEKANPTWIREKIGKLYFKDRTGIWQSDCRIEELDFAVRTTNCLKRESIDFISEVALAEYDKFSKIRNMGKKSIEELLEYLRTCVDFTFKNKDESIKAEKIYNYIKNSLLETCPKFEWKFYEKVIRASIIDIIEHDNGLNMNDTEMIMSEVLKSEIFLNAVRKSVLLCIHFSEKEVSSKSLFANLPYEFREHGLDGIVLDSLIQSGSIEKYKKGYRLRLPNIDEWLETIPDNRGQVFLLRLEGKTLQEIGENMNLTRERVRQIIANACHIKPLLREDDYAYWYSKYACDAEAMRLIFGIDSKTYNYLNIVYKRGTEDIEKILDDSHIDAEIYGKVNAYVGPKSIVIGDECVPCKRELLCQKIAKQVCSEQDILSQDLFALYMDLLEKNNLQGDDRLLFPSERAFESRMQKSLYILMKYGRRLRYYVIKEHDIAELIDNLHFERFVNVEISTLKLFRDYPELMDEYDIRDEYELHNLLKKTESEWNTLGKVSVNRMPFLVFGNADRKKQTEELMYQLAPISLEDFGKAYEDEYGVLKTTAIANMAPMISNYLHDGMFSVNQAALSDEEKVFLSKHLTEDFYFTEDIKKIFVERFGYENSNHLNPRTIKEQGYRIYVNYLINSRFLSSSDYFSHMITKEPRFDLSTVDRRLIYVQQFNASLETLRSSLEVIEYEDGKYLCYSHFTNVLPEYDKQALARYISDTLEYAAGTRFFTIKSLVQDGYDHPLHHIGFGDWFNAALLKNSKRVSFVRTGGTILFYEGATKCTTVDFLRFILTKYHSLDIYDLIELLQEDYGICAIKEKIIQLVKESELYYAPTMEKLYLNKEYFYEEV